MEERAGTTELTAEVILASEIPDDPRISPDGTRVVWSASAPTYEGEHARGSLWWADLVGSHEARRLTADGDHHDHHPRWSPSGLAIAFLSDRRDRGTAGLFVLPVDGGEGRALVERDGGSVATFAWSPNGRHIVFAAPDERTDEDRRREEVRDDAQVYGERWPYARLHLVDVETGAITALRSGDRHVRALAWSPDGDAVAFLATPTPTLEHAGDCRLWVHDIGASGAREVAVAPQALGGDLVWLADRNGGRLVWVAPEETTPQCRSVVWSVAADGADPRMETAAPGVCEIGLSAGTERAGAAVIVAAGVGSRVRLLDGETSHDEPAGDLRSVAMHRDDGELTLAMVRSTAVDPWELWVLADGALRRVSDHQAAWRGVALADQESFRWTAADGLELEGLVLRPPGAPSGPLPTVVYAHGGPYARWSAGFNGTAGNWGQWLATAGFCVLMPNPRGGMGRGNAFATCVRGAVGHDDFDDVMAMVDAAVDRGVTDPDRLAIAGWSQGGFMAAWAVTQTDRFACAVMGAGVSDWGALVMDTDVPGFEAALGGSRPWDGPGPHASARNSPISFASAATAPVLILHGEQDERIPLNQATGFARALREHGVEVEQVTYPRAAHGPRERAHQQDIHRRVRAWLTRWLDPDD